MHHRKKQAAVQQQLLYKQMDFHLFFYYDVGMKYAEWYTKITENLRTPEKIHCIQVLDKMLTGTMYVVYPAMLVYVYLYHKVLLVKEISIPAVSFLLVSLFRKLYNRPRPYESGIIPLITKDTQGQSMPSRHIFSSAVISMGVLAVNIPLGGICWMITILNAGVRVIGGVHYPSDVTAGILIGFLAGLCILF